MIDNLYAKYLLADRLQKVAQDAGVRVDIVALHNRTASGIYKDVHLQCSLADRYGPQASEDAAVRLLDAAPDSLLLSLDRSDGLIYLRGTTDAGLTFQFYTGTGVCEMVQTGTRTVRKPDPKALASVPLVDVEEPVFERRCPDPVTEAVPA